MGQHCKPNPAKRLSDHVNDSKTPNRPLHHAIAKYGIGNFRFDTLSIIPVEGLDNMECYWAEQLGTYVWDPVPGYNASWCGIGGRRGIKLSENHRSKLSTIAKGRTLSKEARAKLSSSHKGKKKSEETRAIMSAAFKGRKMSEETRLKISEAVKARHARNREAKQSTLTQPTLL